MAETPPGSRVIRADALEMRELANGWATETEYVGPDVGARNVSIRVYRFRPSSGLGPYHMHTTAESVYFVLVGVVRVRLGDQEHLLGAGDLVFIPPGEAHSIGNGGPDEATILELYAPGETDFVRLPFP